MKSALKFSRCTSRVSHSNAMDIAYSNAMDITFYPHIFALAKKWGCSCADFCVCVCVSVCSLSTGHSFTARK